jgi:very-short-patch-repair endonuclease
MSEAAVEHRLRTGRLHRVFRGVYLVGHTAEGPRTRPAAALLATGEQAVLGRRTAGGLHLLTPSQKGDIEIAVTHGHRRTRSGISTYRTSIPSHHVWHGDGLRLTSPAWTVVDLASVLSARELGRAVNEGRGRGLLEFRELRAALTEAGPRRGTAALRALLEEAPPLTESEAEHRLDGLLRDAGLEPDGQVPIGRFRLDRYFPAERVAIEMDGFAWHRSRERFLRDRRRWRRLAALGVQIVPVTWHDVTTDRVALVADLMRTLATRRTSHSAAAVDRP